MKMSSAILYSGRTNLLVGVCMALLWAAFAFVHVLAFRNTGNWSYLVFCAAETAMALMFLIRSEPVTVSTVPGDWMLAIGASYAPFLFYPSDWGIVPEARLLLVVGSTILLIGVLSLNRSIGVVAAKREIKTGGMYRFVRHPLYASYFISFSGYVLSNTSARNVAVFAITMVLLVLRLLREERHLAQDPAYRAYMGKVKYRVMPLVF